MNGLSVYADDNITFSKASPCRLAVLVDRKHERSVCPSEWFRLSLDVQKCNGAKEGHGGFGGIVIFVVGKSRCNFERLVQSINKQPDCRVRFKATYFLRNSVAFAIGCPSMAVMTSPARIPPRCAAESALTLLTSTPESRLILSARRSPTAARALSPCVTGDRNNQSPTTVIRPSCHRNLFILASLPKNAAASVQSKEFGAVKLGIELDQRRHPSVCVLVH